MRCTSIAAVLLWYFFSLAQVRVASRMIMEERGACSGLSAAQCCEQTIVYGSFRATGDQPSRRATLAIRVSCQNKARLANSASCKNVAFARGLPAKVIGRLCERGDLRQKCKKNEFCKDCNEALIGLGYKKPFWICYAATVDDESSKPSRGPIVVELPAESNEPRSDGNAILIKKRHFLK